MSIDPEKMHGAQSVLEIKSSTFFVPVMVLYSNDLVLIEQKLQQKVSRAPEFFSNSPIVFDLQELNNKHQEIDVIKLVEVIRKNGLFPIGVRGGNECQVVQANSIYIPEDTTRGNQSITTETPKISTSVPESQPKTKEEIVNNTATLITQPVRSGQRIYVSGDLIILTQVSAGAEIMAEGNIHVYNTLRGRALAGVQGNTDARIFCFDLQAELISIAGDYKTSEDLKEVARKKPVQIYLQNHALIVKELI
ncbi:septum site-determining protein MinC [Nitrosomonas nitrosa]|jgi:septum site-determining protein MinC|uniref:Probable septum site-determining protein MinC n=1 Tax=Nitrosomonas nitrosa TaxID=52442 RepID=A0A1I4T9T3_9PROT|nr:septum site-determining protein MinC [Nitrosomonas nitrosa]PTR02239.1 septum site-determining protein MinC [Nitrosomonas nitrosa]CAE6495823.1 putative septum site-determining protein MinC [Nitrosomonas nitrosa]SFM73479.1 septum site-determining protein MinC [Nitrosomonas nitrosa]